MAQKLYGSVGTPETSTADNPSPATRTEGNFDKPSFVRRMYRMITGNREKKKKKKGTYKEAGKAAVGSIKKRQQALDEAAE